MKIDYNEENKRHLQKIVSADGTCYFILLGNLSGKPDSVFKNPTLDTIRQFFNPSFINILSYQAVVIGDWKDKMYSSIKYALDNLQEWENKERYENWIRINGTGKLVEPYKKPLYLISGDQDRYFEFNAKQKKRTGFFK